MNTFDVADSRSHILMTVITILAVGELLWIYCFDLVKNLVHILVKKAVSLEKVIFSRAWNIQGVFSAIFF